VIQYNLLKDWLSTIVPGLTFRLGPDMLEMADRAGLVTPMQGLGLSVDGNFDRPAFQITIRGLQSQVDFTPADDANAIDKALIWGDYPHTLWGDHVIGVSRVGGSPVPNDVLDKGRRALWTCTYWFECPL